MNLLDSLKTLLPADQIKIDADSLKTYGVDWTRYYLANPLAVVFPRTTEEVQKIIIWANENKIACVPSGGRTGLSGGAVAQNKELVISLEKMNQIGPIQSIDQTLFCQAGAITENVQNYLKEKNLYFPIDFAARGSCMIGGNIATNAGGIKVLRYGLMRDWVASITVVTASGKILNLNKSLIKNATGYDLRHLFIGSEGSLGIVTEVELKYCAPPASAKVMLLAIENMESVMNVYKEFKQTNKLLAFEFFSVKALKHVVAATGLHFPISSPAEFYILIESEIENQNDEDIFLKSFENCLENSYAIDGVLSQNEVQAKEMWRFREDITESLAKYTPYKNDISVRISMVPQFMADIDAIYAKEYPNFEVIWFGHIGDGNLHISILKPQELSMPDFVNQCRKADTKLFECIAKYRGSISAEHGVGLLKKSYLHFTKSEEEIQYMKEIKKIFDPNNILNPGKIFDL